MSLSLQLPHQHTVQFFLYSHSSLCKKYGIGKVGIPALTVSCCVFQARNIKTGELAAVKIIKLEPGKRNLCPARPQTTSVIVL